MFAQRMRARVAHSAYLGCAGRRVCVRCKTLGRSRASRGLAFRMGERCAARGIRRPLRMAPPCMRLPMAWRVFGSAKRVTASQPKPLPWQVGGRNRAHSWKESGRYLAHTNACCVRGVPFACVRTCMGLHLVCALCLLRVGSRARAARVAFVCRAHASRAAMLPGSLAFALRSACSARAS